MVLLGAAPLMKSFHKEMKEVLTLYRIHRRRLSFDENDSGYKPLD